MSALLEALDGGRVQVQLVEHGEHDVLALERAQEGARASLEVDEQGRVGARELAVREHRALRLRLALPLAAGRRIRRRRPATRRRARARARARVLVPRALRAASGFRLHTHAMY